MVPSIIGEDLTIKGNVTSKGEIQVDGEIEGDISCSSLLVGDKSKVTGGVAAEDVVVRGHILSDRSGACASRSKRNPMWKATSSTRALLSNKVPISKGRRAAIHSRRARAQMARRTPGPIPRVQRAWRLPPRRNS
jgi:Polymer-forming cytoskeletal